MINLLKEHLIEIDHGDYIKFVDNIGASPGHIWRWEEGYRYNAIIISRYPLMAISSICGIILLLYALYYGRIALRKRKGKCILCGYPLHGLPTPTCPECGFEREETERH